jgi:PAS domain S-box-containing protein
MFARAGTCQKLANILALLLLPVSRRIGLESGFKPARDNSMPNLQGRDVQPGGGSPELSRTNVGDRLAQFEKRQRQLWRLTYFLLSLLTVAYVAVSWETIRSFARRFEYLLLAGPVLILLVAAFIVFVWRRNKEIAELRGLVRGIEQHHTSPPSDKQLDKLFSVIERSQQGYRDLIDSFDDVLVAVTLDGEIRAANRSFADLVGATFQEIIGHSLSEFLQDAGGDGPNLYERSLPRFLEKRHWSGVAQIRLKMRHTVHYFECVIHAMMRENEVHGMTILARDITASRRNEARFTELFETLQEGIYIVTPEDEILDANPALVRILGYDSKSELLSKKVSEIFPDASLRKLVRQEVDQQPVLAGREIVLIRKDGTSIICLNTAASVRDPTGKIIRYQGALMDITERREIERRLHKQQEFAHRLVDSFPDLILVLDVSANYTFVSPRCLEVLGYIDDEISQMKLGACTHPDDLPKLMSLYHDLISGKQSLASLEMRVRHKMGEWRRILFNFSPLFDENEKIEGVVLSGRDVTDLKRLEEQLIQAEKLAAMGQMLAGVAHELNNPLTAILGVTELVREREGLDQSMKRQLDLTHRQARRAARIVQNLLEFSRPASPQRKAIDISTILERTLQLHEHSLRRNQVEVDFTPRTDLPPIVGDANQLIQVFLNLISNAEQAIREVRESGRIQIRLTLASGNVITTVQDDGIGISPEAMPKLFDPFYTTKRPGGGTGLGLSICLSIAREHGGTMQAEALPGGGSAFSVYLPAATEASVQSPAGAPQQAQAVAASQPRESQGDNGDFRPAPTILKGLRVLVLDDEESICSLLDEGLSAHGLNVSCASTAEEAAALARSQRFDALLCDLRLKSANSFSDGREASAHVMAAAGAHRPLVIFMTGEYVDPNAASNGDAAAFLQKPFRIQEVLAIMREAFVGAKQGSEK